ncbi:hypothetical protein AN902_06990 [Corynebacterium pseudotuberculosis]|nr:hypothetical protein AN902_06990 [Corynebacterium pseudotuberculosis]
MDEERQWCGAQDGDVESDEVIGFRAGAGVAVVVEGVGDAFGDGFEGEDLGLPRFARIQGVHHVSHLGVDLRGEFTERSGNAFLDLLLEGFAFFFDLLVVVEGADLLVKLGDLRVQFEEALVGFVIELRGFAERDDPCLLCPDFLLQGLDLGGVKAALFGELFFKNAGESMVVVLDGFQVLAVCMGEVGVELFEVIGGDASVTGEGGFHDRQFPCQLVELLSQGSQLASKELLFLAGLAVGIEQVKIGLSMDTRCLSLRLLQRAHALPGHGRSFW